MARKRKSAGRRKSAQVALLESVLDTMAELVAGSSLHGEKFFVAHRHRAWAPEGGGGEALFDSARDAIVEACTSLARLEAMDPEIWQREDWRVTCDAMARELEREGTDVGVVRAALPRQRRGGAAAAGARLMAAGGREGSPDLAWLDAQEVERRTGLRRGSLDALLLRGEVRWALSDDVLQARRPEEYAEALLLDAAAEAAPRLGRPGAQSTAARLAELAEQEGMRLGQMLYEVTGALARESLVRLGVESAAFKCMRCTRSSMASETYCEACMRQLEARARR